MVSLKVCKLIVVFFSSFLVQEWMEKLGQVEKVIKLCGVFCVCICKHQPARFLQLSSVQPFVLFDLCSVGEARDLH